MVTDALPDASVVTGEAPPEITAPAAGGRDAVVAVGEHLTGNGVPAAARTGAFSTSSRAVGR